MFIEINAEKTDEFTVVDENDLPITGLVTNDFVIKLYDPDGSEVADMSGSPQVTVTEIGNEGLYRISFTPNKLGQWVLHLTNSTYFPWGKAQNYTCVEILFDTLSTLLDRILGLNQENYRLTNTAHNATGKLTSGLIKLFASASDCEDNINETDIYQVTATYDGSDNLQEYKVVKQ